MRKFLIALQVLFLLGFVLSIFMVGNKVISHYRAGSAGLFNFAQPVYDGIEDYDPSLQRIKSVDQLVKYSDSLYNTKNFKGDDKNFEEAYTELASDVLRKRFYHGYSNYNYNDNFVGVLGAQLTIKTLTAIVIPDDILHYPYAACSQQAIVLMEVLKRKGFFTRKVGFSGKNYGHFCVEVYYKGGWHFYDTDMEPGLGVLRQYNRPGVAFLATHHDVLLKAYSQFSSAKILDIFSNFSYGPVNKFPAAKAIIFQKLTKFLSYTIWLFFGIAFLLVRWKYLAITQSNVRHSRILFSGIQRKRSASYNTNYSA